MIDRFLKTIGLFVLFAVFFVVFVKTAQAQQSIYSRFDLVASSESVPLNDMVSGWDSSYQRGEIVFADAVWSTGYSVDINAADYSLGQVRIQREQRHYYYLSFDKETADFYRALELGQDLSSDKELDLSVKQFEAKGVSVGFTSSEFQVQDVDIRAGFNLSLYQLGHFQFANIKGIAEAGDATAASAVINYRYDEDKILDHQADVDNGLGISFSAHLLMKSKRWQSEVQLKDLVNRLQWDNGAYTQGCINIGGGNQVRCQTDGAASGVSGQGRLSESIPYTLNGRISHLELDASLAAMKHDAYYRLGIEKGLQTSLGRFALFLYYPRLIGASWQTKYVNFQLGADTLKFSQARNIQLNMGINWHW